MEPWIPYIAGAVIALIALFALVKILKMTIKLAGIIASILFASNFFGYGPGQLVAMLLDAIR